MFVMVFCEFLQAQSAERFAQLKAGSCKLKAEKGAAVRERCAQWLGAGGWGLAPRSGECGVRSVE